MRSIFLPLTDDERALVVDAVAASKAGVVLDDGLRLTPEESKPVAASIAQTAKLYEARGDEELARLAHWLAGKVRYHAEANDCQGNPPTETAEMPTSAASLKNIRIEAIPYGQSLAQSLPDAVSELEEIARGCPDSGAFSDAAGAFCFELACRVGMPIRFCCTYVLGEEETAFEAGTDFTQPPILGGL